MTIPEHLPKKMSVEEYLVFEERSPIKHEYVNGRIFAMTGGTMAHGAITINISSILRNQLKGARCKVYSQNVKVRVDAINSFYYPDAFVDCGAFQKSDLFTKTPVLIFEVLSRSTASTDRREKLFAYQQIPSLTTYVLVAQGAMRVDVYRRKDQDDWTVERLGANESFEVALEYKTISISVDEIYEDIEVDSLPDLYVSDNVEVYTY